MDNKTLNGSMEWALSLPAKVELKRLVDSGIDYDLAFAILEREWSEQELYDRQEGE